MTSPNVWIEMDTDATARGNTVNSYQRPSTKEYIPEMDRDWETFGEVIISSNHCAVDL